MLWRPKVGCALTGREAGEGRVAGSRGSGAAQGAPAPVHCALCGASDGGGEERGREGGSLGGARRPGPGSAEGRGLVDTAAGVGARAVGNPERRRDLFAEGEGAQALTQGAPPL